MITNDKEIYLDTCNGFLQEVPESLENGRSQIQLSAISVSKNFICIGSECGALFLYNRNLNRTVKPLRTNECDAVTALELYANEDTNYLAVGRSSGTVFLMCMPSEKIRKIRQSIQDEIHRGQIITCVHWSPDGKRLYSADISGQIIAIDVDFDNELYSCIYISDKSIPIRDFKCSNNFIIFCTSNEWNLIEAKNIKLIKSGKLEDDQELQFIAATIIEEEPAVVYSNGKIQFLNSEEKSFNYFDESFVNARISDGKGYFDGIFRDFEQETSSFTLDDFKVAHFYQSNPNQAFFWSSDKLLIIEFPSLLSKCFNLAKLTENDLFEIITVAIDPISFEIFILSRDYKILRLAAERPLLELITAKEPKPQPSTSGATSYSIVNSFMSAAQNSSSLFSRLSSIKEFDKIKELRTNPTISDLSNRFNDAMTQVATKSVQSAESGQRLANELFDQFKNSQITSDFDATGKITKIVERENENPELNDRVPVAESPVNSEFENEKELIVTRRKKTKINPKRDDLYGISPSELIKTRSTEEYLKDAENKLGVNEVAVSDVEDHTVEAIIRGDFTIPSITNHVDENETLEQLEGEGQMEEDKSTVENGTTNGTSEIAIIDVKGVDENDFNEASEVVNETYSDANEAETNYFENVIESDEDESLEAAAARSQKLAEKEIEKEQDAIEYDTVEDISTSIISLPKELQSPDYLQISNQGNLLWRLHKSKAYAPDETDETSPVSQKWHIQADHAKIIQISLTSKHAWYLTGGDIFVQMFLPEMGILHQTDCVFRVHSLTASDHAVWALRSDKNTLITRTGIDPQICPMGVDFVEDTLGGPTTFVSIALYDKTGFGIDPNGYLWFVNGVDEKNPLGCGCWFQTCYPTVLDSPEIKKRSVNQWQIKVSSLGVFFCVGKHLIAAINDIPLTGHVIKHVIPERLLLHDNFTFISASSSNNAIFVCQPNSEVYYFDTKTSNLTTIPHFAEEDSSIISISAASRRLYLLDNCGNLFFRRGFNSEHSPLGQNWEKIDTFKINGPICSIAASTSSLWIVTTDGRIFVANEGLKIGNSPHWIPILCPKMSNDKIDQIRTSSSGKYVWGYSLTSGRGFARSQINEITSFKGSTWIETPLDIKIGELAIGENVVWAIEQGTTKVHRLRNLSLSNIVGIGWRLMPFKLRAISVDSFESRLWGLDECNRLVKHEMDIYPRKCLNKVNTAAATMVKNECINYNKRPSSNSSSESWTDIGGNGYTLCKDIGYL
uniref:Uncharacterized protein n=1 Tax=Panagrolaimus sp. ES5 TaxID=591445 RepID=A0AC34FG66_9BILA